MRVSHEHIGPYKVNASQVPEEFFGVRLKRLGRISSRIQEDAPCLGELVAKREPGLRWRVGRLAGSVETNDERKEVRRGRWWAEQPIARQIRHWTRMQMIIENTLLGAQSRVSGVQPELWVQATG